MSDTDNRFVYLDVLRLIATFAVIVSHITASGWYACDVYSINWNILNFYNSVSRWGVPVFLMISGSLFLGKDISMGLLYRKYIWRIVTAFLFWSLVYALLDLYDGASIKDFFISFIGGHYHLWYMFMIVGMYMIVPFLNKIIENKELSKYFVLLSFIFTVLVPQMIRIVYMFSVHAGDFANGVFEKFNMFFVCGLTLYYILGYAMAGSDMSKLKNIVIGVLGIFGFAATILLSSYQSRQTGTASETFHGGNTLNVLLESIFVFCVISVCSTSRHLGKTVSC